MGIRNIIRLEDKSLRKKSREVKEFNARLHALLDDMRETLEEAHGLGLAAPQVGVLRRAVLIVDIEEESGEERVIELINPEIIEREGEAEEAEGCLSLPDIWGMVKRPTWVRVRAQDRNGEVFEIEGAGMTARAICHETDHLSGVLLIDICERLLTEEEKAELKAEREEQRGNRGETGAKGESGE